MRCADDELLEAFTAYGFAVRRRARGKSSTGACRRARAAEARAVADESVAETICGEDVRLVLMEPVSVSKLVDLVELALLRVGSLVWHIGPLVDYLLELFRQELDYAGWPLQDLYVRLLVPALANMRLNKSKAYGIVLYLVKSFWVEEDWPDRDAKRGAELRRLITFNFLHGGESDLVTGVWLMSHLGIECFHSFDDYFELMRDHIQVLRLYCIRATRDSQHRVAQQLSACATASRHAERRKYFLAAADLIARFDLDRNEFPHVARYKLRCWLCFIVHRAPLEIVQDYVNGDGELLSLCVEVLERAGNYVDAALLYQRNTSILDSCGLIASDVVSKIQQRLKAGPETYKASSDIFAPRQVDALRLAVGEEDVLWVDTVEAAGIAEAAIVAAAVVGVDLEWSSLGDWMASSLALMQIATPTKVFLIDLANEGICDAIAAIFQVMFGLERPLVLGFSFRHDMQQLARSPWASVCKKIHGLCDLQILSGKPNEGLSSLVQRSMSTPFCKVEQRSYWHRRPLRASQRHYAALDAFVLLQVAPALADVPLTESSRLAAELERKQLSASSSVGPP